MLASVGLQRIFGGGFRFLRRFCTESSSQIKRDVNKKSSSAFDEEDDEDDDSTFHVYNDETPLPNFLHVADAISPMRRATLAFSHKDDDAWLEADDEERQYRSLLSSKQISSFIFSGKNYLQENVLVIHPKVRWGSHSSPKCTTPELQLEEAVTLCRSIPGFSVTGAVIVGTDYNTRKKLIWGSGRLTKILNFKKQHSVTALMINVAMLTPLQQLELSAYFQVPVYDRYTVVLSIFKLYAKSQEAHLQIALAEIPYIRRRLLYSMHKDASLSVFHMSDSDLGENNGTSGDKRLEMLRLREHSLRKKIRAAVDAKAAECDLRIANRNQPQRNCVVAVIGYTNAGKTSLIKKLTDSRSLRGENRLFATLDTTIHMTVLPSRLKVILADTIGFISDLPLQLLASFSATLRHVINADILVHVHDLSHPNVVAQHENVIQTLRDLHISEGLVNTMISIGNKVDRMTPDQINKLLERPQFNDKNLLLTSCRTGNGLSELIRFIDLSTQRINDTRPRRLRLSPTSKAIPYLYENDLIVEEPTPSECGKYLIFNVLMNDAQMTKFQVNAGIKLHSSKAA